jgi:hypothetical protein
MVTLAVSGRDADEEPAESVNVPASRVQPLSDQCAKTRSEIRIPTFTVSPEYGAVPLLRAGQLTGGREEPDLGA